MNSNKVLVQWNSNWADEMDVEGFQILTDREWETIRHSILQRKNSFEIYVGTNEDIEYSNGEELLEEITVTPLTLEEAATIEKFFGDYGGHTAFLDNIEDEDDDEDWEDDDEDE